MNKVNLLQKLSLINDHWNPRIIGELNGQYVKLVKFEGPFTWHHHETEDEMFLVVKGRFRMEFREAEHEHGNSAQNGQPEIWLEEGEFCIVPLRCRAPSCRRRRGPRAAFRAGGNAEYRKRR